MVWLLNCTPRWNWKPRVRTNWRQRSISFFFCAKYNFLKENFVQSCPARRTGEAGNTDRTTINKSHEIPSDFWEYGQSSECRVSEESHGQMSNVRLPLRRQLEKFHVVPLDAVDHNCKGREQCRNIVELNKNSGKLFLNLKMNQVPECIDSPLSNEWWVLAWQTSLLIPPTISLFISISFSFSFFLPSRITVEQISQLVENSRLLHATGTLKIARQFCVNSWIWWRCQRYNTNDRLKRAQINTKNGGKVKYSVTGTEIETSECLRQANAP